MSILSSRAAKWIVPIWLIVVGLIGLMGVPLTSATSVLLIIAGLVAPTITLSLWNHLPRSSKVRHQPSYVADTQGARVHRGDNR
jgi:predicted membrane metal-binding protein